MALVCFSGPNVIHLSRLHNQCYIVLRNDLGLICYQLAISHSSRYESLKVYFWNVCCKSNIKMYVFSQGALSLCLNEKQAHLSHALWDKEELGFFFFLRTIVQKIIIYHHWIFPMVMSTLTKATVSLIC